MPEVRPATERAQKTRTLRRFTNSRDQPTPECVVIRAGALSTEEPRWPQLYLPAEHDEADLVLAGLIAELVDSAELYVTWTAAQGPATPADPRRAARAAGPRAAPC